MMATTHAFAGLAIVAPIAVVVPEFAPALAVGAIFGGVAPDFDLAFEHRRTFHYPILGAVPTAIATGLAAFAPAPPTAAIAAFSATAWLHAASDALGGGPEMDPWTNPSDRAVYDHRRGRWIRPRRWIRYDGAPEDGLLAVALAVPALLVFDGWIAIAVLGGVAVSLVYTLLRRRLVAWTPERFE
ncbi:metal-dependent hydrolase [Halosolutus gelatinilyticus]|uniref:metal-dependent hydrolase n=1 Tax=Halosolutus gelatinilyticus TaxID=2931975 RepID=UPI001FF4BC29|nr:metal-dependent hydrolase [Halosolutus gelatinilyticus]